MPLTHAAAVSKAPRRLARSVRVKGERLYLAPLLAVVLPRTVVGQPVESMRRASSGHIGALDVVVDGV